MIIIVHVHILLSDIVFHFTLLIQVATDPLLNYIRCGCSLTNQSTKNDLEFTKAIADYCVVCFVAVVVLTGSDIILDVEMTGMENSYLTDLSYSVCIFQCLKCIIMEMSMQTVSTCYAIS